MGIEGKNGRGTYYCISQKFGTKVFTDLLSHSFEWQVSKLQVKDVVGP